MIRQLLVTLFVALAFSSLDAQIFERLWTDKAASQMRRPFDREIIPNTYRTLGLNAVAMRNALASAPEESLVAPGASPLIIAFPTPDGGLDHFRIVEYDMMDAELKARFPEIRTYRGVSTGDPLKTVRFDWTVRGISAMISGPGVKYFVDPYARRNQEDYISYHKSDYTGSGAEFECHVTEVREISPETSQQRVSGDCTFRSYRLAVAATGEYSNFHDAVSAADEDTVLSAIVISVNRVNEVYEKDVTIRLILISATTDVFYYDGTTDPYSGSACSHLNQNQTTMNAEIGSANYDIGHVFSVGSGGCAGLRVPCTGSKARGATGLNPPIGDPFWIDYVAHEMGHQFGGNHCFNNSCGGNRNSSTAYEPGSGATIMAYAGICNPNVQSNSDDYFHGISVQEINDFTFTGSGNNCDTPIGGWTNNPPVITSGADYTIPASTPFMLIAHATDADGDPLNYLWEQWDQEIATMPPVAGSTTGPMFRSFDPSADSIRYFPRLSELVNNSSPTWEVLPTGSRGMDFRVTVKDFHNGIAGCADEDNVTVSTTLAAGPFLVTSPNTGAEVWGALGTENVTWNVAGTDVGPINCANVDIILSTDGGLTYTDTIALGVPNTGSANVNIPGVISTTARVMIKCSDNIFFDISNQNFEITGSDFTLNAINPVDEVCPTGSATFMLDIGSIGGFSDPVTLGVGGVPGGASFAFDVNPVIPGSGATLTVSNLQSTGIGTYPLTVSGTSSTGTKNTGLTLIITQPPGAVALSNPADGAIDVPSLPTYEWTSIANASTYDLQVAADQAFVSIVESVNVSTTSHVATVSLTPLTTYFWRVRAVNGCAPGQWSEIREFTTRACYTYVSTDVPVVIPVGGGSATVSSLISVPDMGTITDVNILDLSGDHTWMSDLDVFLITPSSTSIELFTDICGSNNNFDLDLDDEATTSIPCPPTSGGTHQPEGSLSDADGRRNEWYMDVANHG